MRATHLAGSLACVLLVAACTSPVQHRAGDAAPAGSPPAAPTASATTPPAPTATTPAAGDPATVLGPFGLGPLRLGMTREQATATGLITPFEGRTDGCDIAYLRGGDQGDEPYVMFSPGQGIAAIDVYQGIETPEGAHLGMSSAAMVRLYPSWRAVDDGDATSGRGFGKVAGNPKADYRIVTKGGVISELTLQLADQRCYE